MESWNNIIWLLIVLKLQEKNEDKLMTKILVVLMNWVEIWKVELGISKNYSLSQLCKIIQSL